MQNDAAPQNHSFIPSSSQRERERERERERRWEREREKVLSPSPLTIHSVSGSILARVVSFVLHTNQPTLTFCWLQNFSSISFSFFSLSFLFLFSFFSLSFLFLFSFFSLSFLFLFSFFSLSFSLSLLHCDQFKDLCSRGFGMIVLWKVKKERVSEKEHSCWVGERDLGSQIASLGFWVCILLLYHTTCVSVSVCVIVSLKREKSRRKELLDFLSWEKGREKFSLAKEKREEELKEISTKEIERNWKPCLGEQNPTNFRESLFNERARRKNYEEFSLNSFLPLFFLSSFFFSPSFFSSSLFLSSSIFCIICFSPQAKSFSLSFEWFFLFWSCYPLGNPLKILPFQKGFWNQTSLSHQLLSNISLRERERVSVTIQSSFFSLIISHSIESNT